MVDAVTSDYESLDYTTESAASVLGVLVVLSGASDTIGSTSKVCRVLSKSEYHNLRTHFFKRITGVEKAVIVTLAYAMTYIPDSHQVNVCTIFEL